MKAICFATIGGVIGLLFGWQLSALFAFVGYFVGAQHDTSKTLDADREEPLYSEDPNYIGDDHIDDDTDDVDHLSLSEGIVVSALLNEDEDIITNGFESDATDELINPATSLPMVGGISGLDVGGNPFGTDLSESQTIDNDIFGDDANHNDTLSDSNLFDDDFSSPSFDDSFDDPFESDFGTSSFDDDWS